MLEDEAAEVERFEGEAGDVESPELDNHSPVILRWLDMSPAERFEQRERAAEEAREYRADSELARQVQFTPMGWMMARRAELSPALWARHVAEVEAFVERVCVGVPALMENYLRLASMRGDSIARERALFALAYAMGSEGAEAEALAEAEG